jgi:chromosome segregation ATPase
MQEEKQISVPSSSLLSMMNHNLVLVDRDEYEKLKKENQDLKKQVSQLEHNADMFRQQIETDRQKMEIDRQTIEELKRENEELKRKVEQLEKKLADQNMRIRYLENENNTRRMKEVVKRLIIGLQDFNRHYQLELVGDLAQCRANLEDMRENRNDDCHMFNLNSNENRVSEAQKAWRYSIKGLDSETRSMLDSKCGGKYTVDAVVNYLASICKDNSSNINQRYIDWLMD